MFTHEHEETNSSQVPTVSSPSIATNPPIPAAPRSPSREKRNRLPDRLQAGMEALSGLAMNDVRVHYNSALPATLNALAYTRGIDIHLGPGQERHLPHEAWHVVQQKQGRVYPTTRIQNLPVNDAPALEAEADRMGRKAVQFQLPDRLKRALPPASAGRTAQRQAEKPSTTTRAIGNGRYQIELSADGQTAGSITLHDTDNDTLELTDLGVNPIHRKRGLGQQLLTSAVAMGSRMGKSKVTLASQDNGSGRLHAWYRKLGFTPTGTNRLGFPVLEAPVQRRLLPVVQRMHGPAAPVMTPAQQGVIDQGNVHRGTYQLPVAIVNQMPAIVNQWGNAVPNVADFQQATRVFFALRSSDPALTQIDTLLGRFHAAAPNIAQQAVHANHLLLACNFWLQKVNVDSNNARPLDFNTPGNLPATGKLRGQESRRAGIAALSFVVENWLQANGQPHTINAIVDSMTRPNRGVNAGHGFGDVHQWNNRQATRIPANTSTNAQRGAFHADPDTRLFSLDDDNQKRVAKLVFRGGTVYRWGNFLHDTGFQVFDTPAGGVHYVMDKRGRIYAGTFSTGYFWHSSLVGFADALSAGFIVVNQGTVTRIKNDSGHYHPRVQEMVNMLLRLQLYGVNLANVSVERKADTHPLGAAVFTAAQILAADPGKWPDDP